MMKIYFEKNKQQKISHLFLLITKLKLRQEIDGVSDLFLLRYSFLLNDTSKPQNSCGLKKPQLNAPQGNIYMGARYLDPKYSRWISVDPALGEYVPGAGKGNSENAGNLPGMGGIYNHINGRLYHYAGNNPVRYMDPDGRKTFLFIIHADTWWEGFAGASHCGLYFSNPKGLQNPVLYDPSGSFRSYNTVRGVSGRERTGFFGYVKSPTQKFDTFQPSVKQYLKYHLNLDKGEINIYIFNTSREDEYEMIENAQKLDCPGSHDCSDHVSTVLGKLNIKYAYFPGNLEKNVKKSNFETKVTIKSEDDIDNFIKEYDIHEIYDK